MKSEMPGSTTSAVEVTNISKNGLWLLVEEEELFLPFAEFPWFLETPAAAIFSVGHLSEDHLYWRALDVDLSAGSTRHPERFPLVSSGQGKPA